MQRVFLPLLPFQGPRCPQGGTVSFFLPLFQNWDRNKRNKEHRIATVSGPTCSYLLLAAQTAEDAAPAHLNHHPRSGMAYTCVVIQGFQHRSTNKRRPDAAQVAMRSRYGLYAQSVMAKWKCLSATLMVLALWLLMMMMPGGMLNHPAMQGSAQSSVPAPSESAANATVQYWDKMVTKKQMQECSVQEYYQIVAAGRGNATVCEHLDPARPVKVFFDYDRKTPTGTYTAAEIAAHELEVTNDLDNFMIFVDPNYKPAQRRKCHRNGTVNDGR